MIRKINISLRVKFTSLVVLLLLAFALISSGLSNEQLVRQQATTRTEKIASIKQSLLKLEEQSLNNQLTLAEQIGGFARYSNNLEAFRQTFTQSWQDLNLISNLQAFRMYLVEDAQLFISVGEDKYFNNLDYDPSKLIERNEIDIRLVCIDECVFISTIPVFDAVNPSVMLLVEPFSSVLASLAKIYEINVAVLKRGDQHPLDRPVSDDQWPQNLASLTNHQSIISVLTSFAKQASYKALFASSYSYQHGSSKYEIETIFHKSDTAKRFPILLIDDITRDTEQFAKHRAQMVIVITISIAVFGAIVISLTVSPLCKVKRLIDIYPSIALHNFDEARRRLPNNAQKTFPDEIDILHQETSELITKLQTLYSDVEDKNRTLEYQAYHDELTGLGNRNRLNEELTRRVKNAENAAEWAVVELDLDNFKHVNDTLGHNAGDELLKGISQRLRVAIRSFDTVCRLGGDEFVIVLDKVVSRDDIQTAMNKLFSVMAQPIDVGDRKLAVNVSAGICHVTKPYFDGYDVLKAADIALYEAKSSGKNCYKIYDEEMSLRAEKSFIIENDFYDSLQNEEFYLLYQPQVCSQTGKLIGFEALVRWRHQEMQLFPNNFIPILEESDKINLLGRWVAKTAIKALSKINKYIPGLRMSINISARQLQDSQLLDELCRLCGQHNIDICNIELEITESHFINDIESAEKWIRQVRDIGFRVAIDDFGTGYSSLSYISRLTFDTVKLDRSFIRELTVSGTCGKTDDRFEVLSAIIFMIKKLSDDVVAEGVEDAENFALLKRLECDILQGFFIEKPKPLDAILHDLQQCGDQRVWPTLKTVIVSC